MTDVNRRQLCSGSLAALTLSAGLVSTLAACGKPPETMEPQDPSGEPVEYVDPKRAQQEGTLEWAVSGTWRNPVDQVRDKYRHPIEMLTFFEIKPNQTVIDMWPGAGYMSEILGPWLAHGKGNYVAAMIEGDQASPAAVSLSEKYKSHFSDKSVYGTFGYTEFGPDSKALAPGDSVDTILFLLVIQDWMAAGTAEKAFSDAFAVLKPGGILGVEQHRADVGNVQDSVAANGYVQEPFVKQLATEAGFQFVDQSEMNANPKDDKDHPFGVWTLPPQRLTAPKGQPPNPEFDGSLYESIGESDRMTMKFRKPQ